MLNELLKRLRGGAEDDAMVRGQQGPVPMNADVAHFQTRRSPEDASLVNGPQGYGPINADIGNFRGMTGPGEDYLQGTAGPGFNSGAQLQQGQLLRSLLRQPSQQPVQMPQPGTPGLDFGNSQVPEMEQIPNQLKKLLHRR